MRPNWKIVKKFTSAMIPSLPISFPCLQSSKLDPTALNFVFALALGPGKDTYINEKQQFRNSQSKGEKHTWTVYPGN